jgi:hypothetical protein
MQQQLPQMQQQLPQMQQMVQHQFPQQHQFIVQIHPQFVVLVAQTVYAQTYDNSISNPSPQVQLQPVKQHNVPNRISDSKNTKKCQLLSNN